MAPRSWRTSRLLVCPSGASDRVNGVAGVCSMRRTECCIPRRVKAQSCFHQLGRCLQTSLRPCWSPLKLAGGSGEPQGDPEAGSLEKIGEKERGGGKGGCRGTPPHSTFQHLNRLHHERDVVLFGKDVDCPARLRKQVQVQLQHHREDQPQVGGTNGNLRHLIC